MLNIGPIDGVVFDLGFSSFQLENPERGFSFSQSGPLDMRMSPDIPMRAWDLVNKLPLEELNRIIREYGEDFRAFRIAKAIVRSREKKPINTTAELAGVIESAVYRRGRIHPATRTFQALRIAVNGELENLKKGLDEAAGVLKTGGRICVISFHSLEDRIVKYAFRGSPLLEVMTRKPLIAAREEVEANPRARSAKLRVGQRR